jgi:hypothetical protein
MICLFNMNKAQKITSARFGLVVSKLKESGIVQYRKEVTAALDTYPHILGAIIRGDRAITIKQVGLLYEKYGVNINYLFGTSEVMFVKDLPEDDLSVNAPDSIIEEKTALTYEDEMQEEKMSLAMWMMRGGLKTIKANG